MSRVYARYVLFVWYNYPESCRLRAKRRNRLFLFFLNLGSISEFCTYPGLLCGCILQLDQEFPLCTLNFPL